MKRPLVTCLCVTRDRPEWLAGAVRYFLLQTFEDAELLIVADGTPVIDGGDDPRIRVVNLPQRPATLGEKRNIGCEAAAGKVIAVWDDDDYHAPGRLRDQLLTLMRSGLAVTAYNKMKFTDGRDWFVYDGMIQSVGIGGSLCFTREFWRRNNFPLLNEAEDNALIRRAWEGREFVATQACAENATAGFEDTDKMVATIHRGNTSVRDVRPGGNYRHIGQSDVSGGLLDALQAARHVCE